MAQNNNTSGSDRAKGKDLDLSVNLDEQHGNGKHAQASNDTGSATQKITASATALSSALLFGRPGNINVGELGIPNKPASIASGSSQLLQENGTLSQQHGLREGSSKDVVESMHSQKHDGGEEARYSTFLTDFQSTQNSWPQSSPSSSLKDEIAGRRIEYDSHTHSSISAVAQQEARDGGDLVGLLSEPDAEQDVDEHLSHLSPEESSGLRRALFGDRETGMPSAISNWNNLLNFQPDFLRGEAGSEGARQHLGTQDTVKAQDMWLASWKVVLTSYTDEVWGELGPLAHEARNEVDESQNPGSISHVSDLRALERLRLILAHIRGS